MTQETGHQRCAIRYSSKAYAQPLKMTSDVHVVLSPKLVVCANQGSPGETVKIA